VVVPCNKALTACIADAVQNCNADAKCRSFALKVDLMTPPVFALTLFFSAQMIHTARVTAKPPRNGRLLLWVGPLSLKIALGYLTQ
jgi:hypothetical protein